MRIDYIKHLELQVFDLRVELQAEREHADLLYGLINKMPLNYDYMTQDESEAVDDAINAHAERRKK